MTPISRRGFVRTVTAALPVTAVSSCTPADDLAAERSSLDPVLLRSLAEVVLPVELGLVRRDRAVTDFEAWLAEYRPVGERNHGYGTGEISYTGADPGPGWGSQLRALDLEAMQRFGSGFAELEAETRRGLVRGQLRRERGPLPDAADAQHIATALVAFWANSMDAADLCYGARIGRETCRPLDRSPLQPAPLTDG